MDSCASVHFFKDEGYFIDLRCPTHMKPVRLAADKVVRPTGIGTVQCDCLDIHGNRVKVKLDNSYLIPQGHFNLISVGRLLEHGLCESPDFGARRWTLAAPDKATVPLVEREYVYHVKTTTPGGDLASGTPLSTETANVATAAEDAPSGDG